MPKRAFSASFVVAAVVTPDVLQSHLVVAKLLVVQVVVADTSNHLADVKQLADVLAVAVSQQPHLAVAKLLATLAVAAHLKRSAACSRSCSGRRVAEAVAVPLSLLVVAKLLAAVVDVRMHAADTPSQLVAAKLKAVLAVAVQLHHHAVAKSLAILADAALLLRRSAAC